MIFDYLADKPWLHAWLMLCGAIVTLAIICMLGMLVLEIIKGLVLAVDFQRFKMKAAKYRERPYKFRFSWFFNSWMYFMGWGTGHALTSSDGDRYLGLGRWVILGKFTTVEPSVELDPEDLEDDDEDYDDESSKTSDQKRP